MPVGFISITPGLGSDASSSFGRLLGISTGSGVLERFDEGLLSVSDSSLFSLLLMNCSAFAMASS